jgi:hypothetical protein
MIAQNPLIMFVGVNGTFFPTTCVGVCCSDMKTWWWWGGCGVRMAVVFGCVVSTNCEDGGGVWRCGVTNCEEKIKKRTKKIVF